MAVTTIARAATLAGAAPEQPEAAEQAQATASVYSVHAQHTPMTVPLGNTPPRGTVSAINCTGALILALREADGGRVLLSIDAPAGFDSALAIPFSGPLVCDLKTTSSVHISILS